MDNIFGTLRKFWVVSAVLLSSLSSYTLASPTSLNFQGRIMKTDGHPLEHNAVSFIFQITNPTGSCIIYEEQVDGFNMTGSGGVFDVPIGLGSIKHPTGGSFTVLDAFNNSSTFICKGGALFTAASGDLRKLRVQFYDGTGWRTISPDSVIRSVPYAAYAGNSEKLGNLSAAEFVQRAGLPLCGTNSFLSWDGTQLTCVGVSGATGGTVTSVSKGAGLVAGAPITSTGTIAVDVGTGPNQVVQLDSSSKLPAVDGSALTNLNPTHLGTGAIPTANLPAFTGDVTSTAGSNSLTLQTVPISKGGTGATTRQGGINALLPTQASNAAKILQTDGTNVSWVDAATTGLTDLSGDVVATGPGAVTATIQAGAVNSSKIADGSILYGDLNFVSMTQNTGVVVTNGTSFNRKTCNTGETLLWDATNGWECASFSATESDPQVGSNTLNFLSKWNGSALVTSGVFENSGRVGIGNSAPSAALHVTGTSGNTLRIVDGNQAAGRVLSSDANGVATWVDSSTTGLAGITGDVVATGPGTASSSIQNGAVTSAKILDGTIAYGDLNFITMPVNSGIVVSNGTAFNSKQCGIGETLIWDLTIGWKCGTFAASETDPKVGSNTTNYVSKWNGSALVTSGIFDNGTNVGIGTSSPSTTLHIAGSSGSTLRIVDGNQGVGKVLVSNATGVATWTSLNTGVSTVTATAPVVSSGGSTPDISMAAASTTVDGYLTAANFVTFNNKSPAAGSTNITTLGTITTGTWNGSIIPVAYGGTGTSNGSITGTGALTFAAGGSNQNVNLTPSGSGIVNTGSSIRAAGEVQSTNANTFRSVQGNYGVFFRNDATNFYLLSTASGDQYGSYNSLRPFSYSLASGQVDIAGSAIVAAQGGNVGIGMGPSTYKLQVAGDIHAAGWLRSAGNTGWYNETYAGGWYMSDATWIRSYGSKNVFVDQTMAVGGNLGVGTTSPSERLEVAGTVKATSFISTSDRRLKKDIVTVNGLDTILKLRGVKFNWRSDGTPEYGTIAQEVEAVLPDLVITDKKSGYKGVKYIGLIAPLIEATKDLNNKCDMSAAQIQNLAAALQNVKSDVIQIKRQLASVIDENAVLKEQLKALSSRLDKLEQKDK